MGKKTVDRTKQTIGEILAERDDLLRDRDLMLKDVKAKDKKCQKMDELTAERDALALSLQQAREGEKGLFLPFPDLKTVCTPSHPRAVNLSLSPSRRRKLHAILAGLGAKGETFLHSRGSLTTKLPVAGFADVFYWLLDKIELQVEVEQCIDGAPVQTGVVITEEPLQQEQQKQ